jgi:hypothetical protein
MKSKRPPARGPISKAASIPEPPGPPVEVGDQWKDEERGIDWGTWIEEDGTQLLGRSCRVLAHRKSCITSGAVVIVHRNLEEPALQIRICGINPEALTTSPRNL